MPKGRINFTIVAALAFAAALTRPAGAEEIAVGNFGVAANGMPFGVALEKGFFKQEGIDVTGIITSAGGGTSLRNMLAGGVPYGEVNPGVVIAAIQQGADLKIISDNVLTVAEFVWAVKPDSPIKTIQDFKGRKIGYTNPRSTSQGLAMLLLTRRGLQGRPMPSSCSTGGFGEGVAALDIGQIDVAPIAEPLWSKFQSKYRAVARGERHPAAARQCRRRDDREHGRRRRGDFIRAVIRARRQRRRVHDRQSRRSRRHRRQGLQSRAGRRPHGSAQPHHQQDRRRAILGARADPSRGHEADDRGPAHGWRDLRHRRL